MPSPYESYIGLKFARPIPRVLEVIFDRPGKLNALTEEMHRELAVVWRDIEDDPDVSCVLLRGANDTYSAGGDLSLVQEMTESFEARAKIWKETRDLVYGVINCSKPIVSAINGPAVGAGLAAGLLADISIASKSARIIDGIPNSESRPAITPRSSGRCSAAWPRPNTICCYAKRWVGRRPSASVWFRCA